MYRTYGSRATQEQLPRSKNLSKQCLDSDFWASPEFMILNQRYPGYEISMLARMAILKFYIMFC